MTTMTRFDGGIQLNANRSLPVDPRNTPSLYHSGQQYTWEKGFFTVPASVSDERVSLVAHRYMQKFGEYLETPQPWGPGYRVLAMEEPKLDTSVVARGITDPDRKRYIFWAKVRREPVVLHVEVPDEDVPLYLACGYKLSD